MWLALTSVFLLGLPRASLAGSCDTVIISNVDISKFPEVTADIGCLPAAVPDLTTENCQAVEDGKALPVSSVSTYKAPLQVAFVLDAAGNIDRAGASGEDVRIEYLHVIEDFALTSKSLDRQSRTDQVMLTVPEDTTTSRTPMTWGNDYNNLRNKALEALNGAPPARTALKSMLMDTLAQMNDLPGWRGNRLAVVVISDGIDTTSAEDVTDVVDRATAIDAALYTIKVGPSNRGDAATLQRLAKLTGGAYAAYSGEGSLDALQEQLAASRNRVRVTYRSAVSQQGIHGTAIQISGIGSSYASNEYHWSINLLPPSVTISSPQNGMVIERVPSGRNVDPALVEPTELGLTVRVDFPDSHPRAITKVALLVNGVAQDLDSSRPAWNMANTRPGKWPYSLVVQAYDELGLVGESEPINVIVDLQVPEGATCAPNDWLCLVKKNANWLAIGALTIALAVVAVTKRREVVQIANSVGQKVKDTVAAVGGRSRKPLAFLVATDAAGNPTERYAIVNPKTTIGRDRQLATLILDDETVSKYHAQLLQNRDNSFLLNDEGSSNGTFVNDRRLGFEPVVLQDNDVVYFGQCRVVFRLAHDGEGEDTEPEVQHSSYLGDRLQDGAVVDDGHGHYVQKNTEPYRSSSDRDAGQHH
ncbi:MAG: FHA domain-containing protein [Anaerolineales bacterium]